MKSKELVFARFKTKGYYESQLKMENKTVAELKNNLKVLFYQELLISLQKFL